MLWVENIRPRPNASEGGVIGSMSEHMLTLSKFSIGVGDRFARQARAQLRACQLALEAGVDIELPDPNCYLSGFTTS